MYLNLTYQELAERLGIKPNAARVLAQRNKWSRIVGNDGRALVAVPEAALRARQDRQDGAGHVPPARTHGAHDAVLPHVPPAVPSYLEAENLELRAALEHERGQREADRATRDRLAAALTALLERVGEDEVARREEVARALEDRDRAREDAEETRAELRDARDAVDRQRATIGRMFDDLRGLADQIAEAHAVRADAERQVETIRIDLAAKMAEHARLSAEVERLRRPWWLRWKKG